MLARGCVLVETEWAYEMIVEMHLDNPEEVSEEKLSEWNEYKALAYEKLSLWKEAGTQYRILSEQEKKREEKEEMYREKFMEMDMNYLKDLHRKIIFNFKGGLYEQKKIKCYYFSFAYSVWFKRNGSIGRGYGGSSH